MDDTWQRKRRALPLFVFPSGQSHGLTRDTKERFSFRSDCKQRNMGQERNEKKMKRMYRIVTGIALSGAIFCGCSADVEVDNSKAVEKRKSVEETKGDETHHTLTPLICSQ